MSISVRISPVLRTLANCQDVMEVAAASPMECLSRLEADFPRLRDWMYDKNGQFSPLVQLFVNGERVYPDEWDRDLQDGDELFLMLAIGGG